MAGNTLISVSIFRRRPRNPFGRQSWRGGALVPADFFKIIANVLLVEGRLSLSRKVFVGGPEPRRIRCERLVDPYHFVAHHTELKFRVGNDDSPLSGIFRREPVNLQACFAQFFSQRPSDARYSFIERNVLVVPSGSFGRGRKNRLWQLVGFAQSGWQGDPADRASLLIVLPPRTRNISAHNALDRNRLRFLNEHPPADKGSLIWRQLTFKILSADHVVRHHVRKLVEPEKRELRQHSALVGNRRRQHNIKRR